MAKLNYRNGVTSVVVRVKILDSASTTGAGKTGLTEASAGLILSTIADNEATTTRYRASSSEIETITTLGTYAAPTAGKCRFKEVDATNHPGLYEIQIADARWAVSNARSVIVSLLGASGMVPVDAEIQLEPVPADLQTIKTQSVSAGGAVTVGAFVGQGTAAIGVNASGHVSRVVLVDTVTTYTGNTPQTGDAYARLGAPAGASIAADILTTNNRLTSTRAGYLDNLSGGLVATSTQVASLQVNTRANISVPIEIETPDASTLVYKIRVHLFDSDGNMEAPDSTPTVALTNAAGTNRASRLSVASNPSTGVYTWDYTATAGDAEEQLVWVFTIVEGGLTRTYAATSYVVEETAYRFSSTDRATLNAIAGYTDSIESRLPPALDTGRIVATVGAYQTGMVPLQPTVAGRTLDVTVNGNGGIDWGNVENPGSAVSLSGTSVQNIVASNVDTISLNAFAQIGLVADYGTVVSATNNTVRYSSQYQPLGTQNPEHLPGCRAIIQSVDRYNGQNRIIIAAVKTGNGTDVTLTLDRDWDENPTFTDGVVITPDGSPTASQNATAWGNRVIGNGRTADYFLQGGFNKTVRNANSFTVYSTDDTTVLASAVLAENGALNPIASVDPA